MTGNNFGKTTQVLLYFSLASTIIISITIIVFGLYHDHILYELYIFAESLLSNGFIDAIDFGLIDTIVDEPVKFLNFIDILWVYGFVIMIYELFHISYRLKRIGYFSFFSFITFGVIFWLFISSLIYEISSWFRVNFIDGLLSNISLNIPFYHYYMNNYGLVNLIIIAICLILNVVDLDLVKFNTRKNKDLINDEA